MPAAVLKAGVFAISLAFLGGCVAPGSPTTVKAPAAIAAAFPNCRFINPRTAPPSFVTSFYLTTYGSAFAEGSTAGTNGALNEASDFARPLRSLATRPFDLSGERLVPTGASALPYCVVYADNGQGSAHAVNTARSALRAFGYSSMSIKNGLRTSWRRGGHQSANWFDRYTFIALPTGSGGLVGMVRREVYIQRAGFAASFDEDGSFYEAASVGANEAWLLANVQSTTK